MDLNQIKVTFLIFVTSIVSIANISKEALDIKENSVLSESVVVLEETPTPTVYVRNKNVNSLFNEVNNFRTNKGLQAVSERNDLCDVARVRLDEQIKKGRLDGHEGFKNLKSNHQELSSVFSNYGLVAEFLAYGGRSSKDTVTLWYNSPDHRKLLEDPSYKYGCIVSSGLFAVAITAY